jgi:hypothetical protein
MDAEGIKLILGMLAGAGVLYLISHLAQIDQEWWRKNGVRTRGVIVRNNFHVGRISVSRPVVQFTTQAGVLIEAEDIKGLAMAIPSFSAGKAVWVAYNSANPYDFVILSSGDILG